MSRATDLSRLRIFEGLTATSTFVLTPAEPIVANRGYLQFESASVYPASGLAPGGHVAAQFRTSPPTGAIGVKIYGAPGRTYVIDLLVDAHHGADSAPAPLEFRVGSGPAQQLFINADSRSLIAFAPTSAGWYLFTIRPAAPAQPSDGAELSSAGLTFYSATVSVLQ